MGIRGLTGWIRWVMGEQSRQVDWSMWKGKKIGVDILGFLYKAKAQHYSPLLYLAKMIIAFKKYDIIPVPIFDGKPPDEKRDALKQRSALRIESESKKQILMNDIEHVTMTDEQRNVVVTALKTLELNASYLTSDERDEAKQLFYAAGIIPLNATGEADNVLAYFSKRGYLDAVISNDLDLLARGVKTLLVPENYALPGDTCGWHSYVLPDILKKASITYPQFVDMCVLMGCDYTVGHKVLPYKSAYWSIKYGLGIESALKKHDITNMEKYKKAAEILCGMYETTDTLMGSKQWEKLHSVSPKCESETLLAFRQSHLRSLSDSEFEWLGLNCFHGAIDDAASDTTCDCCCAETITAY
jgi:5'-3' exonuclease